MKKVKKYIPKNNIKISFIKKGILLYLLSFPLLIALVLAIIDGDFKAIILNGIAYSLYLFGANIARKGFEIEREYKESILTKAPKIKFKTLSAIIITFATFFTAYFSANHTFILSTLLSIVSFIGFYLYYGLDPKIDKIGDLNLGVNAEDVINITNSAKQKVKKLETLEKEIKNSKIKEILKNVTQQTTHIIKSIQRNPNDLSRSRKFFNVYLDRTYEITDDYVNNLKKGILDDKIQQNYIVLLKSIQETIKEQKERLDEDDITKLDIQIEALTNQIKNEGV